MGDSSINTSRLKKLIADAKASGGSERGTYQTFINRLCEGLGLAPPDMNKEDRALNGDVYERRVTFNHADGSSTSGFMDCYKRDCFILEAKQSRRHMREPKQSDYYISTIVDAFFHLPTDLLVRTASHHLDYGSMYCIFPER